MPEATNTPEIQARIERLNREHPPAKGMEWERINDWSTIRNDHFVVYDPKTDAFRDCVGDGYPIGNNGRLLEFFRQVPAEAKEEPANEELAKELARIIFAIGDGPKPCTRIQFMAGKYDVDETPQGGVIETALAVYIREALDRMGTMTLPETVKQPEPGLDYERPTIPEELYDGHAVFSAIDDKGKKRTGPENVSDVLDAVVRLIKQRIEPKPEPDVTPDENTPWGTLVEVADGPSARWRPALYITRGATTFRVIEEGAPGTSTWCRCRLRREGK